MKLTTRGFTLVELMIVIAIIGILAASLFPSMAGYLKRSRDAARTSHLKDIATTLGAYYADNERYPTIRVTGAGSGCILGAGGMTGTNYFPKGVPTDPTAGKHNGCATLGQYAIGSTGQTTGTPGFAILSLLENSNGGNFTGTLSSLTGVLMYTGSGLQAAMGISNKGLNNFYVIPN